MKNLLKFGANISTFSPEDFDETLSESVQFLKEFSFLFFGGYTTKLCQNKKIIIIGQIDIKQSLFTEMCKYELNINLKSG